MSAIFSFEAPPEKAPRVGGPGRKSTFGEALAELRDHKDKWARITDKPLEGGKAAGHAARIRHGNVLDVEPGEFETQDNEGHLYAKYVGAAGIKQYKADAAARELAKAARAARKAAAEAAGETPDPEDESDDDGGDPRFDFDGDAADDDAQEPVATGLVGAWG